MQGGYAGYGQAPAPYGQQIPMPDKAEISKGHKMADEDGEFEEWYKEHTCPCCTNKKSSWARIDNWCIYFCIFGGLLCMMSTFIPSWRVDDAGTTEITKHWDYSGFESRSYGIIHVKASWSQSWTTLAQAACDVRNLGQLTGLAAAALSLVNDGDCAGSESCQQGFSAHMHARCTEYQTLMRISMVTLCGTFLGIICVIAGTLITSMSKRKKSGGIAFGLYMFAGILLCSTNAVWAGISDNAFKNLSKSAWYPYPSLGAGWYIHTVGYLLILISNGVFGYVVLPTVWAYDPAQEKLDKKKAKLAKKIEREQAAKARAEELKGIIAAGQQAPPGYGQPPPGYGQPPPQAYGMQPGMQQGYGQAYPQPAPMPVAPLGFAGQSDAPIYGQGGAMPVANPGDFGLDAGYAAQQPQGYGYAAQQPDQYGGGTGGSPYSGGGDFGVGVGTGGPGMAPGVQGGDFGVGAQPGASPWAAQGQPAQPQKPAYHWPAFSGE